MGGELSDDLEQRARDRVYVNCSPKYQEEKKGSAGSTTEKRECATVPPCSPCSVMRG